MLNSFLKKFSEQINGVIHVGAHKGQEVLEYVKTTDNLILFEPQKNIYQQLLKNTNEFNNIACYNFALGSKNENRKLYKSDGNEGLSSSLLTPELHLKVQPNIGFKESEEIIVKRFDSLGLSTLNFLTIDVQGFELEVIKGFGEELEKVDFIFTEINTKNLYSNNALVHDIDNYLKSYNFIRVYTYVDCFNFFGDAFYIKKTNKKYKKSILNDIKNLMAISNFYLKTKQLFYPKRVIKNLIGRS
jgi:FkbM family methyltransferase